MKTTEKGKMGRATSGKNGRVGRIRTGKLFIPVVQGMRMDGSEPTPGTGVTTRADFGEWYNEVIERADLSDKRYPIKGMNVWKPYGWKAMRLIDGLIREEMERTGHGEVHFPLLIPRTEFAKEGDHIKGFDAEVYWVTRGGLNELDVPLLLRPTSETAMYPMFNLWIRSHGDLPLRIFQIVNVFRYETKMTKSFIRVREIHFFESHTAHADLGDAERQIRLNLEILERFARKICIPHLVLMRPEWDKFAGAHYTLGIDCLMPDGKTLQLGSIHQYRTNFSIPYDIRYEDENGEHRYAHQTTYGMSERLIGAVIGVHGDDRGIIFPPAIAPYQAVVVPILVKGKRDMILGESELLMAELKGMGYRAHLDARDMRPGAKYYDWELRGVPLRIELGPRDIEGGQVVVVRRDTGEKAFVPRDRLGDHIASSLSDMEAGLWNRAAERLREGIRTITDLRDGVEMTGILKMHWCGAEECARQVEIVLELTILGHAPEPDMPEEGEEGGNGSNGDRGLDGGSQPCDPGIPGCEETTAASREEPGGMCIHCKRPASTIIYAARTY